MKKLFSFQIICLFLTAALLTLGSEALAEDQQASLAQKTQNPVAELISLQLGYRYDADAPKYAPDWGLLCADLPLPEIICTMLTKPVRSALT